MKYFAVNHQLVMPPTQIFASHFMIDWMDVCHLQIISKIIHIDKVPAHPPFSLIYPIIYLYHKNDLQFIILVLYSLLDN